MSSRPHALLRPGSRLWPVFELLRDRGEAGATSLELAEALKETNLNISTTAADIRKVASQYGYEMLPAVYEGKRGEGASARKVYRYRLVRITQTQPLLATCSASIATTAIATVTPRPFDLFGDSRRVKW